MKKEWAFLAGLGVGAVLGLVFAPRSGSDSLSLAYRRVHNGLDQVSSAGKKAGARLADLAERGKEQVAGALDAAAENLRGS